MTQENIDKINHLIGKGKLKEALELLYELSTKTAGLRNAYLQISRRLNEIEEQKRKGLIDFETYTIHRNNIAEAVIEFGGNTSESANKNHIIKLGKSSYFTTVLIWLIIILIGLFFILQGPTIMDLFVHWKEQNRLLAERERIQKTEFENNQRRIDSLDRKTQEFIDSLITIKNGLPKLKLEEKRFSGIDNNGLRAEYIIYFIRGFNWRIDEVAIGEKNGVEFNICDYLSSSGINTRINNDSLKGIICFGNASFEEDLSLPASLRLQKEEDRADKRAVKLANCVNDRLYKMTPIFTLNLGKHEDETDYSEWQRQIIIIGLIKKENETVEEEALFNGLVKEHYVGNLEFNVMDYSKVGYTSNLLKIRRMFN